MSDIFSSTSIIPEEFVDSASGNVFRIEQAKGLPEGERALIFLSSAKYGNSIPPKQFLCLYSATTEVVDNTTYNKPGFFHPFNAYAVAIKKGYTAFPTTIEPSICTLGLFANGALGGEIDPIRQYANATLCMQFRKH